MKLLDADNQHHVEFSLEKAICAKMVCYPCAIGQGAEKSRQKEQPSAFFPHAWDTFSNIELSSF